MSKINIDEWEPGEDVDNDAIVVSFLRSISNFVRTPEWSVSMLEDIAGAFERRFEVDEDFEFDDPQAWQSH